MKRGGPLARRTPLTSDGTGLARGKPLARGKGLDRGTPLARGTTPLGRGTTPLARSTVAAKRPAAPDPVTPATRAAVRARSGGRCEAGVVRTCAGVAQHVHHRKLRRHGDHTVPNLLDVCLFCHDAIHGRPAWSYEHGFLVRGHDDPARIPWGVAA